MSKKLIAGMIIESIFLTSCCLWDCIDFDNAEAVLAGNWETEQDDGSVVTFSFNQNGILTQITRVTPENVTISANVPSSSSNVSDSNVAVVVTIGNVTSTYNATLDAEQNTLDGNLTTMIEFENVDITIPSGDLTLEKV
jgi:hypothetical protein